MSTNGLGASNVTHSKPSVSEADLTRVSLVVGPAPARVLGLIQGGGSGGGGGTGGGGSGGHRPEQMRSDFWNRSPRR